MKKRLFVYIGCALVLSGCAHWKGVPTFEERRTPQVTVRDGRIVVPEVLFYFKDERDFDIVFQLPREGGLTFPEKDSVVIEGELTDQVIRGDRISVVLNPRQNEIGPSCVRRSEVEVACRNRHTRPGVYKYTIRVTDKDRRTLLSRDPPMVNM